MLGHWDTGRPPSAPSALQSQILLVGDPVSIPERSSVTRSAARRDERGASEMLALPGARREIATIAQIATGWRAVTLVREQATKTAVLAQPLETFRVLHFATHARLDVRDPQLSAIVLSGTPAQVGTTAAALSLREVVGLELNADTVVLSACEGSLGKEYRGQLSLGLSESFLLAGARNVVGGLWPVADAATERYMQLFYEQYVRFKSSPQVAAQTAARAMMNTEKYAHPFYWAAFVVVSTESAAGRPQVQREAKRR
jgi:CHAT domain-containing protein